MKRYRGLIAAISLTLAALVALILTVAENVPLDPKGIAAKIVFGETVVFAVLLVIAIRLALGALPALRGELAKLSREDRRRYRLGALTALLGLSAALALTLIGRRYSPSSSGAMIAGLICAGVLPALLAGISRLSARLWAKRIDSMKVAEMEEELRQRRELAAEQAESTAGKLRRLRLVIYAFAALILASGAAVAVLGGMTGSLTASVLLGIYAGALISIALARLIPFPVPEPSMKESRTFAEPKEFPRLYSLAEEAAREMGFKGGITIEFSADGSIGIARLGNTACLVIGVFELAIMSEDELGSVLRHEFAHAAADVNDREAGYVRRTELSKPRNVFTPLEELIFTLPDIGYSVEYFLYGFASSVLRESEADRAMTVSASKETAASALIKVDYYSRYEYERPLSGPSFDFSGEKAPRGELKAWIEDFKSETEKRGSFWDSLIMKELPSRKASHPTTRKRLEALGVEGIAVLPFGGSEEYVKETGRAADMLDEALFKSRSMDYEDARRENYEEPMERLEKWREEGEPVAPETYRGLLDTMLSLEDAEGADALAERVIRELPENATYYARFILGTHMLRRYDDRGLELIYEAMEANNNAVENGLAEIGTYCCITGNEKELERYRERALELAQEDKDVYSETGVLKRGDRLSREELPEGVLEETLRYILSFGRGEIERIYLVRKTITADFYTSVFVIRFRKGANARRCGEIMRRTFEYLDTTTDWQYSLFEYEDVKKVGVERVEGSLVWDCSEENTEDQ